jgi:predicted outer membrane repeat protein
LEDRFAPAVFNVNSLADVLTPPDGTVTLRSAIQMANATPGSNTINLTVPGTYKLAVPGTGAEDNASGDFDILPNADSPAGSTLTIRNTSGGQVVVDGNHLSRVFDINPNDVTAPANFTVLLQGFTIQHGVAQPGDEAAGSGGGIRDQGNVSLTLSDMTITNNCATADGGGIAMENAASTPWTLTISNSTITNNHAGDAGGGIETDGSGRVFIYPLTVITGNTSVNQGAGIWLDAIQVGDTFQSASLTVIISVISNNRALSADGVGGGIGNAGNGAVTILYSTLANNFAGATGGGFGDENAQGSLTVMNSTFLDNTATGNGGGIAAGGPLTSIADTEIDGNASGGNGGGLFTNGLTLYVRNSTFTDNTASGDGGGIANAGNGPVTILNSTLARNFAGATGGGFGDENAQGLLTVLNSTFLDNTATGNGGGIAAGGPLTSITNTEIDGNASGGTGGGLFANGVTLTVGSSTFANNMASGDGGGIDLETTGAGLFHGSTIINATITGNTALNNAGANGGGINAGADFTGDVLLLNDTINANLAGVGGGIFWAATLGSNFGLQNTLIAGNFAADGPDAASDMTFTDLGGNLVGVSGPGSGNTGFTSASTQAGTTDNPLDPLLGPLQDNGGPAVGAPGHTMTLQTEALLSGSPAIGQGILPGAPFTDERGFPSVINGTINVGATSGTALVRLAPGAAGAVSWEVVSQQFQETFDAVPDSMSLFNGGLP